MTGLKKQESPGAGRGEQVNSQLRDRRAPWPESVTTPLIPVISGALREAVLRGPCGRAWLTYRDGGWSVHFDDKGFGWGRRLGQRLDRATAERVATRAVWDGEF